MLCCNPQKNNTLKFNDYFALHDMYFLLHTLHHAAGGLVGGGARSLSSDERGL